uniref:Uncharacterized protein n=1 Tax=Anopheles maculatus TaxID=74869 RepID=A0A182SPF3_9DIPT
MALTQPSTVTSTATKGANATYQQRQSPRRSGFSVASGDDGYQFARGIELANTPPSRKSSAHRRILVASQLFTAQQQQLLREQCLLYLPRVAFPFAPFTLFTFSHRHNVCSPMTPDEGKKATCDSDQPTKLVRERPLVRDGCI